MVHPSVTIELTKALDRWIGASKTWSEVAHKTFVEMAGKAREDVITKGDFSFVRQFRMQFGIGDEGRPTNGMTTETEFNMRMQPIQDHFGKFAREYEKAAKRSMYIEMLRSGRTDEFIQIMRGVQKDQADKARLHPWGVDVSDCDMMQKVWQEFNADEQARQRRQQEEENRIRIEAVRAVNLQRSIEAEARRRIEHETFEAKVQAKIQELKASR